MASLPTPPVPRKSTWWSTSCDWNLAGGRGRDSDSGWCLLGRGRSRGRGRDGGTAEVGGGGRKGAETGLAAQPRAGSGVEARKEARPGPGAGMEAGPRREGEDEKGAGTKLEVPRKWGSAGGGFGQKAPGREGVGMEAWPWAEHRGVA